MIWAMIFFGEAIEGEMLDELSKIGLKHYSLWKNVTGVGHSGAKMGTVVWPEFNTCIGITVDREKYRELRNTIVNIKSILRDEGIKMFAMPVEDIV